MQDHILTVCPKYPPQLIRRKINDNLRNVISKRVWSGLTKQLILSVPAAFADGTIDAVTGSNVVIGTATGWPVDDLVSTTLSADVISAEVLDATPGSMAGVEPNTYMLIDGGGANEEGVYVYDTTATTFKASFTKTHLAGETITRSSLSNLQLKVGINSPFYTATGFSSPTRMILKDIIAQPSELGASYSLSLVYTNFAPDLKMLISVVNLERRYRIIIHMPKDTIDYSDPHRTLTQTTYMVVSHEVDPAGSQLYELYPRPVSEQAIPFFYHFQFPPLVDDGDILPNGIRSDVLVRLTTADALVWPKHKIIEGGIYYDPAESTRLKQQAVMDIEAMEMEDDNTMIMRQQWSYADWPFGGFGADWHQSHDWDSYAGWV